MKYKSSDISRTTGYAIAICFVLAWRIAAFISPSHFITVADDLRLPVTLLGFLYLTCGTYAHYKRPNNCTFVFFLYAVGSAVHWGGSIGVNSDFEIMLLFVYLAFSALGEGALLHVALIYPSSPHWRRSYAALIYMPAGLAMFLAGIATFVPRTTIEAISAAILIATNLLALIAGILFVVRYFLQRKTIRRASRLAVVIYIGIPSSIIAMLGSSGVLYGRPDAWNLIFGVLPVTLAFALISNTMKPHSASKA